MVAMASEVVERAIDTAEEAGPDQLQLELLQRTAMKLFRHLDLDAAPLCRCNDCVGFVKPVGDRRFQQDMQTVLDGHQSDFAIRAVGYTDNADLRRGLTLQAL